jgi:3-(methylthio)propionyl---CoA ligase
MPNEANFAHDAFERGLERTDANHQALTPLGFIARAALIYPGRPSVVHGTRQYTWRETYDRCRRLASALARRGIGRGDTVAVMAANTPEIYEAHFGVPMTGAVLNTLNIRLDAATIAHCLQHGGAKALITDREFAEPVSAALQALRAEILVIDIDDAEARGMGRRLGALDYEALLEEGDPGFAWAPPDDEWQAISLNYTSGTTGDPKGVVYHHRGAYLTAIGNVLCWQMPPPGLSLDAADVPRQWFVFPLDAGGGGRPQRLPAWLHRREHLAGHRQTPGDPLLRRAHRA